MTTTLLCHRDEIPLPSEQQRTPIRPLGLLSDFVVTKLPGVKNISDLPSSNVLTDMCKKAREALTYLPYYDIDNPPIFKLSPSAYDIDRLRKMRKIALLDSAMLEQTYVRHEGLAPLHLTNLTELCAQFGNARRQQEDSISYTIPALTYEGVIHSNPLRQDPRVFSDGETGRAEVLFYEVHRRIEEHLAKTLCALKYNMVSPFKKTHECINIIKSGFRSLLLCLKEEEFGKFRGYFQNAHRRLPGPSGLFSAGMAAFDNFLAASEMGIRQLQVFKLRQKNMFPTTHAFLDSFCGQEDMMTKQDNQKGRGNPAGVEDFLLSPHYKAREQQDVAINMQEARGMHVAVAQRFLPEAFKTDNTVGTGGTSSLKLFLNIAQQSYADLVQKIPLLAKLRPPKEYVT